MAICNFSIQLFGRAQQISASIATTLHLMTLRRRYHITDGRSDSSMLADDVVEL
jgi:hypothetical protein